MSVLMQQSLASGMGYRGVLNITLTDTQFCARLIAGDMVIAQIPISAIRAVTWKSGFLSDTITVNYDNERHQQKWFSFKTASRTSWLDAFKALGIKITKAQGFF